MSNTEDISQTSVTVLKGVGPALAGHLEKLQIYTVADLLFHMPSRYEDRTQVVAIGSLRPGQSAVFEGTIDHAEIKFSGIKGKSRSRRVLLCYVSDGTGAILLRFFHFSKAQQQQLVAGARLRCFGEARVGRNTLEIAHPEYRMSGTESFAANEESLTAIYPKTEKVSQGLLRSLVRQAWKRAAALLDEDLLSDAFREQHGLLHMKDAVRTVHFPDAEDLSLLDKGDHPAQQRLIVEELLAHQLSLARIREKMKLRRANALPMEADRFKAFLTTLGFDLTGAQRRVIDEIHADMAEPTPMLRLLQGDVGSGKTVVAAAAALAAIANGEQVAVMAPTEILAGQHFEQFRQWFPRQCMLFTGKDKGQQRQDKLAHIRAGHVGIIIGTHALFQDDVEFSHLSLVVVDEQHRFGVHQRLTLSDKGKSQLDDAVVSPHQLVMTATPIPRSLAMTAYADLDYSVIDELPAGRKPVTTVVIPDSRREEVIERISAACNDGEQAYWVCTMIEESDVLQCQAAEQTAELLRQELAALRIGLVHGRMKQTEKDKMVDDFRKREIDLLVATTVIEVGVNVPNASLMVIENAERLGLAQLHQLRGRVGRGERQSACVLMYKAPLSKNGKQRLSVLRETNSGFVIAEKDLELRGPGEMLGTRQTGEVQLRMADIVRDERWLPAVKDQARDMLERKDPACARLIRRWLGRSGRYAQV